MKIIDLLNRIAKGEEVPNFKVNDVKYCVGQDGYLRELFGDDIEWYIYKDWLNEEAQILEEVEDKEYEDIEEIGMSCSDDLKDEIMRNRYIINALIKNQKYILEQLKNEK